MLLVVVFVTAFTVQAQNSAAEKAANLRAQLADVEAKQAALQTRLKDLDEQMKPENIEHSLAGYGSTRPEDVREQRRKQLEIERNGVQTQLNLLATSHTRLETSIAQADADAYRQSAAPTPAATITPATGTTQSTQSTDESIAPVRPRRVRRKKARRTRRSHHAESSVATSTRIRT